MITDSGGSGQPDLSENIELPQVEATAEGSPELLQMIDFINSNGGRVRFDQYMSEHLFGKNGYYESRANIQQDFLTDSRKPAFAREVLQFARNEGVADRVVEIGGGIGDFKKNYLRLLPDTEYTSIELSTKLADLQSKVDGKPTIQADAFATTLPDRSVNGLIFSNELLDEMPARVLRIGIDQTGHASVAGELFITTENGKLKSVWGEPERDEFVAEYEQFFNENQAKIEEDRKKNFFSSRKYPGMNEEDNVTMPRPHETMTVSVSPKLRTVFEEMSRILNHGKLLFFDYYFSRAIDADYGSLRPSKHELPFFYSRNDYRGIEEMIERPYQTDITAYVDLDYCKWLIEKIDTEAKVEAGPDYKFYQKNDPKAGMDYMGHGWEKGAGFLLSSK